MIGLPRILVRSAWVDGPLYLAIDASAFAAGIGIPRTES